jgi:arylsulfatase A
MKKVGVLSEFMPLGHGFDEYFGVPYSVDMGETPWHDGQFPPLPLINNSQPIVQPVDLSKLSEYYLNAAERYISSAQESDTPFVLYFPLSHIHVPDYMSNENCDTSARGFFGSAMQEMDQLIGDVMQLLVSRSRIWRGKSVGLQVNKIK